MFFRLFWFSYCNTFFSSSELTLQKLLLPHWWPTCPTWTNFSNDTTHKFGNCKGCKLDSLRSVDRKKTVSLSWANDLNLELLWKNIFCFHWCWDLLNSPVHLNLFWYYQFGSLQPKAILNWLMSLGFRVVQFCYHKSKKFQGISSYLILGLFW